MIQRYLTCVLILTPKGTIVVARRLFYCLETGLQPGDLGLLRDYDVWVRLSERTTGIECTPPAQHWEARS